MADENTQTDSPAASADVDTGSNGASGDEKIGTVQQVTGVVLDVAFPGHVPEIYHALEIDVAPEGGRTEGRLICEVQQHLGDDRVRAIAMDATDGVKRGDQVRDTGGPITGPPGDQTPGRRFHPLRGTIDAGPAVRDR